MSKTYRCNSCGRACTFTTNLVIKPGWDVVWCPLASTDEAGALPADWTESKPRGGS
jgi:hypothetical protein